MSMFKSKIGKALKTFKEAEARANEFSDKLAKAMGLSDKDIKEANRMSVAWTTDRYKIYAMNRCQTTGWRNVLEAVPAAIGIQCGNSGVGWSNINHQPFPLTGWDYFPNGTATIVVPNLEIQTRIIADLREAMKKSSTDQ